MTPEERMRRAGGHTERYQPPSWSQSDGGTDTMDCGMGEPPSAKQERSTNGHDREEPKEEPSCRTVPAAIDLHEFLANSRTPEFVIDGIIQRGFLYSLTALTFHGKTTTMIYMTLCLARQYMDFAGRHTEHGRVVYFAGENPDDIAQKFIVACDYWGIAWRDLPITIIPGAFDMAGNINAAIAEAEKGGPAIAVIIDTSSAYREDEDEDDNQGSKRWAQNLRKFTEIQGTPAVIVPVHPIKNATRDTLLPRGGGGYVNEVDGNLRLWATFHGNQDRLRGVTELHWHGKLRGPDFVPLQLDMLKHPHPTWCHRDGTPVDGIVVLPSEKPKTDRTPETPLTAAEGLAMRALDAAMKDHAFLAPVFDNGVEGLVCHVKEWRESYYRLCGPEKDRKAKEKAFGRFVTTLQGKDRIGVLNALVWPKHPAR